jgi:fatty-acyl-CoA synthase
VSILYEALQAQVRARPDAPAVEQGDRVLSYAAFDALIDEQARAFAAHQTLGWLGHNSAGMLAAVFACARNGARFVPLNWRLAAPELAAIAMHADLNGLYVAPECAALGEALCTLWQVTEAPPPNEHDDLLLAYTSGTTGQPKGALHTQAAMLANAEAAIHAQSLDDNTRTLAVLPLFHVGGLCIQVLPTLLAGGAIKLHARFDPAAWLRDVAAWKPTTSLLVPAVMRALIEHPGWADADLLPLAFVNSGSSIVPRSLIEAFHARGVPVAQVYGSTETGPVSLVLRPEEAMAHVGQAGRPARGVQVRLVDVEGHDVPDGQAGELWIRGDNLMRGYHREPRHPSFARGWFHSGDIARRDADGFYEVVGRMKDMIISGGENIYPAEIENLLAADAQVAEAAVVGVPDARWGEVPVLAVVPREGQAIDEQRLRALFERQLARFKHPKRIVVLAVLPKTALGKVRKAELARYLADVDQ